MIYSKFSYLFLLAIIIILLIIYFNLFKIVMINGESMTPFINNGDIVLIKKENTYKVGDIIMFTYNDINFIKKIEVNYSDTAYYVNGTHNNSVSSYLLGNISHKNVIGKYYAKIY